MDYDSNYLWQLYPVVFTMLYYMGGAGGGIICVVTVQYWVKDGILRNPSPSFSCS
jgi:hypothetical protein